MFDRSTCLKTSPKIPKFPKFAHFGDHQIFLHFESQNLAFTEGIRLSVCSVGIAGLAGTGPDPAIQQTRPTTAASFQAFQLVVLIQILKMAQTAPSIQTWCQHSNNTRQATQVIQHLGSPQPFQIQPHQTVPTAPIWRQTTITNQFAYITLLIQT
jgi:hypothetical protein